jgi:hypothetical protein
MSLVKPKWSSLNSQVVLCHGFSPDEMVFLMGQTRLGGGDSSPPQRPTQDIDSEKSSKIYRIQAYQAINEHNNAFAHSVRGLSPLHRDTIVLLPILCKDSPHCFCPFCARTLPIAQGYNSAFAYFVQGLSLLHWDTIVLLPILFKDPPHCTGIHYVVLLPLLCKDSPHCTGIQ